MRKARVLDEDRRFARIIEMPWECFERMLAKAETKLIPDALPSFKPLECFPELRSKIVDICGLLVTSHKALAPLENALLIGSGRLVESHFIA